MLHLCYLIFKFLCERTQGKNDSLKKNIKVQIIHTKEWKAPIVERPWHFLELCEVEIIATQCNVL